MVEAFKLLSEKLIVFDNVVSIAINPDPDVNERWMMNPDSLPELSVHNKLILDCDTARAERLDGADGVSGAKVVSDASEVKADVPIAFMAEIR